MNLGVGLENQPREREVIPVKIADTISLISAFLVILSKAKHLGYE